MQKTKMNKLDAAQVEYMQRDWGCWYHPTSEGLLAPGALQVHSYGVTTCLKGGQGSSGDTVTHF